MSSKVSHVFLNPDDNTIDMANANSSVSTEITRNTSTIYHSLIGVYKTKNMQYLCKGKIALS